MFIDKEQLLAAPRSGTKKKPGTRLQRHGLEQSLRVHANGVDHAVQLLGDPAGMPLLLIPGLGMQLIDWPTEFVQNLVNLGFRVIRYDVRDMGLSDSMDHLGKTSIAGVVMSQIFGVKSRVPYTLPELADDAMALLIALNYSGAHVCGMSMGGMVAQHLASRFPYAVKSLSLLMTSSGSPWLPRPSALLLHRLSARAPSRQSGTELAQHFVGLHQAIASPAFPENPEHTYLRVQTSLARSYRPQANFRQAAAVMADGDRSALLDSIQAPTLILHGKADPLVPPAAARDLAKRIPHAQLEVIDGMGHDIPAALSEQIAKRIANLAHRAVTTMSDTSQAPD